MRFLLRALSVPDLFSSRFSYEKKEMEKAGEGPYLILMNHSSFLDLKIASKIPFPVTKIRLATEEIYRTPKEV